MIITIVPISLRLDRYGPASSVLLYPAQAARPVTDRTLCLVSPGNIPLGNWLFSAIFCGISRLSGAQPFPCVLMVLPVRQAAFFAFSASCISTFPVRPHFCLFGRPRFLPFRSGRVSAFSVRPRFLPFRSGRVFCFSDRLRFCLFGQAAFFAFPTGRIFCLSGQAAFLPFRSGRVSAFSADRVFAFPVRPRFRLSGQF